MNRLALGLVAMMTLGGIGAAQAQSCYAGMADFDNCMSQQLNQMQQQNTASMQQTWYAYLQAYGPQLQQAYQEWGYQSGVSFEQFAYYMLMSANGTDPQGALAAQQRQFAGNQAAHNTVMQGYNDYNAGWAANSNATINAIDNYDIGAVRGDVVVNGPGGPVELPYSSMQVGQTVNANGYTYMMTQQGYAVWTGNGWQMVQ